MSATFPQKQRHAPSELSPPVTLRLRPAIELTPEQVFELSSLRVPFITHPHEAGG